MANLMFIQEYCYLESETLILQLKVLDDYSTNLISKIMLQDKIPVLGICLGMEMFFEKSEEGVEKGFNVIDGEIVVLPSTMKVPHMGWNNLEIKKPGIILEDVADDSWVYFVHSYRAKPKFDDVITAESDYGVKVPAVVEKNNFFGTQFHPEKSGDVGKIMIQNFLNVCKK